MDGVPFRPTFDRKATAMFTLTDNRLQRNCSGYSRRDFLRIGSLGLGGLTLSQLMALESQAKVLGKDFLRDKAVVLLFLQGGPAHIEFFDPKMTAPAEYRSITGEVKTRIPGVTFGATFPQLAERTDKFSIVRSYGSKNGGHTYLDVTSGRNPLKAAMSALYARVAGTNHPATGMPLNTLVKPEAVEDGLKLGSNFETGALPTLTDPGDMGAIYRAFDPSGGGVLQENMQLRMPAERLEDRRSLLRQVDNIRRSLDSQGQLAGTDQFQRQAFDVIFRGVADAFDVSQEDPKTIARYDTSHCFANEDIQRYGDMRRATNLLGRQMLMARRLVENGCRFITVSDCGWDMHANNNSPKGMAGIWPMGHQVDHAVSAFLDDLHDRGLSDKVLLVVTGEMGRTPKINGNGGRDHYGELTSLLLAGGGLKMGQVIGESDANAARPATEPYDPKHLLGTVMHTLLDVGRLRLAPEVPRDVLSVIESAPVIDPLV